MKLAQALLATTLAALPAACTVGAPLGFSSGDSWTIPLVGPMENSALVVPVFVNDAGPYLMLVDRDAPATIIDDAIASELKLRVEAGPRMIDESDTTRQTRPARVRSLRLGTLTVESVDVHLGRLGAFTADQRQIRGVIGRDVLADSLTFSVDRDSGVAYITTQKGFTPPADATKISYYGISSQLQTSRPPPPRQIVNASIGGRGLKLHLDVGGVESQLRESLFASVKATPVATQGFVTDELGERRVFSSGGLVSDVRLGDVSLPNLVLIPYGDRRWEPADIDGTLGLGALRDQTFWINWDKKNLYLRRRPQADLLRDRLDRWNSNIFAGCANPGCVSIEGPPAAADEPTGDAPDASQLAPASAAPAMTQQMVNRAYRITREPTAAAVNLEVLVEARGADGKRLANIPQFSVNLPVGSDLASIALKSSPDLVVNWVVVDASPFPRACAGGTACAVPLPEQK